MPILKVELAKQDLQLNKILFLYGEIYIVIFNCRINFAIDKNSIGSLQKITS